MTPQNLVKALGIDSKTEKGARIFQALTWKIWAGGGSVSGYMRDICRDEGITQKTGYFLMRRALRPIFDADDSVLDFLGLSRPETAVDLAKQVAQTINDDPSADDPAKQLIRARQAEEEKFFSRFKTLDQFPEIDEENP